MVEAAGIEPASEKNHRQTATRLVLDLYLPPASKDTLRRQVPNIFSLASRAEADASQLHQVHWDPLAGADLGPVRSLGLTQAARASSTLSLAFLFFPLVLTLRTGSAACCLALRSLVETRSPPLANRANDTRSGVRDKAHSEEPDDRRRRRQRLA